MGNKGKRKGKGGRPRLPGTREPSGRLSRRYEAVAEREAMTETEAKSVMVEARVRQTGLSAEIVSLNHAGRPHAGNVHGCMALRGELTLEQWTAAEWFIGKRAAWLRSIGAREAIPTGNPPPASHDDAAYADWCRSIRSTWQDILDCIQDAATEVRSPVMSALDVILVRNIAGMDHMVGDLRVGLNAIQKRFLESPRKVA